MIDRKAGWELDEAATTPPVKPGQKTASEAIQ